jgi:hypothetical protein
MLIEIAKVMDERAFMLRKFSLGRLGLILGGILTIGGFVAYFLNNPTLNLVGFFYGIPILLGGAALRAAELKPVPFLHPTPPEVIQLRNTQQTPTLKQLREDVTGYRYGTEAHLLETLEKLKLAPNDANRPRLTGIYETDRDGKYALVLRFDSPHFDLSAWQERQAKITHFFGPGIVAQVKGIDDKTIDLELIVA